MITLAQAFFNLQGKKLSPLTKLFYLWLCSVIEPNGSLQKSLDELAKECPVSYSHIKRCKDKLVEVGLIKVTVDPRNINCSVITLIKYPKIHFISKDTSTNKKELIWNKSLGNRKLA